MGRDIRQFRLATARRLRKDSTAAERRLWFKLRRLPTYGTHFRRQVAIGPYVVDFACMRVRLVVEVDGSQHAAGPAVQRDASRTEWLEREGYRVIRFWNNEITQNMNGVLDRIHAALYGLPDAAP